MQCSKFNLMAVLMFVSVFYSVNNAFADIVGDWHFDKGEGIIAYDSSTYKNNGTLSNKSMWTTSGKVGSALNFDGENYVDCGKKASLNITGNISFGGWVYYTELVNFSGIIKMGSTYVRLEDAGNFKFVFTGLTAGVVVSTTKPIIGKWYHVMGTYDGKFIRVYVNGKEEACVPSTGTLKGLGYSSVRIGKWGSMYHKGKIDEVKIYNNALNAKEVNSLYLKECTPKK